MELNIMVCIKSVPNPELYGSITLDPVTKTLIRKGIDSMVNPNDKNAIELAIQLKEQLGGKVTLLSMGPPDAQKELREGLAYGADEAILLSDRKFGGADTLATSYALAMGAKKAGAFDLILAGNESADGATSHVPSQLGEWLDLPHIMNVVGFRLTGDKMAVVRKKSEGRYYDFEIQLPAVIAVSKEINKVRTPNMMGVLSAKKKPLHVYGAGDIPELNQAAIGLGGSPTQNGELHEAAFGRQAKLIDGSAEEIASEMISIIKPIIGSR